MNIVLLGPPGIKKKQISEELTKIMNLHNFSTSLICNKILEDNKNPYYNTLKNSFQNGLVNDRMIGQLIEMFLKNKQDNIIFSGFPKTVYQAETIDKILLRTNNNISYIFHLDIDEKVLLNKLNGRVICEKCLKDYDPSNHPTSCIVCNEKLFKIHELPNERYLTTIKNKIQRYNDIVKPILSYYTYRNHIIKIKISGSESERGIALQLAKEIIDIPE